MNTAIVLTIVSDDHPGIVESLSEVLTRHRGNWAESSMMTLAGKFAGILLIQVPDEEADALIQALESLRREGMHVVAKRSGDEADAAGEEYTIELVGQDHPGIVHEITEVLAKHEINVLELESTIQSASMSGESLFVAHARIFVPPDVQLDRLQDELEDLANELMVDIRLRDE